MLRFFCLSLASAYLPFACPIFFSSKGKKFSERKHYLKNPFAIAMTSVCNVLVGNDNGHLHLLAWICWHKIRIGWTSAPKCQFSLTGFYSVFFFFFLLCCIYICKTRLKVSTWNCAAAEFSCAIWKVHCSECRCQSASRLWYLAHISNNVDITYCYKIIMLYDPDYNAQRTFIALHNTLISFHSLESKIKFIFSS